MNLADAIAARLDADCAQKDLPPEEYRQRCYRRDVALIVLEAMKAEDDKAKTAVVMALAYSFAIIVSCTKDGHEEAMFNALKAMTLNDLKRFRTLYKDLDDAVAAGLLKRI